VLALLQREARLKDFSSDVCTAAAIVRAVVRDFECLVNLGVSYFTEKCFLNLLIETLLIANASCFLLVTGSGLHPATPAISTLASSMRKPASSAHSPASEVKKLL